MLCAVGQYLHRCIPYIYIGKCIRVTPEDKDHEYGYLISIKHHVIIVFTVFISTKYVKFVSTQYKIETLIWYSAQ